MFTEEGAYWSSQYMVDELREMCETKKFRVVFCFEAVEALRVSNMRSLTMSTRWAVASGSFDFLARLWFVPTR